LYSVALKAIAPSFVEIDRYGFLGADTDHRYFQKFLILFSASLSKYNVFHALPFFEKLQKLGFMS